MASSLLDKKFEDKIRAVIAEYDGQIIGVVATKDRILETCVEHDYAYEMQMCARFVGVHPCNRNGEGLEASRSQVRGSMIVKSGWSWPAVDGNSIAIEDHPTLKQIAKFTIKVTMLNKKFAQYLGCDIKMGSLGAGHCNHWLESVRQGVECTISNISKNGRMSKELCCKDKGVAEAVEKGLHWVVIRWQVEAVFPMVPRIIQQALGTVASVHEGAPINKKIA